MKRNCHINWLLDISYCFKENKKSRTLNTISGVMHLTSIIDYFRSQFIIIDENSFH